MLNEKEVKELKLFSKTIQMYTMKTIGSLGVGHVGGSLSIADLLAVLYGKEMKFDSKNPEWQEEGLVGLFQRACRSGYLFSTGSQRLFSGK